MGRHATALIAELWPYRRAQQVAHRGGDLARHVCEEGPAAQPGGAVRPILTPRAGAQLRSLVILPPLHFSQLGGMYQTMRTVIQMETGADVLVMSDRPEGVR